jgi:ubiquinone/menaquinone biosynthesis C-methylase UbiE
MNEVQKEQTLNWLMLVRNQVLDLAQLKEGQKIADFGCGSGLLGFGILERFEDKVELIFSDKFQDCLDECKKILSSSNTKNNVKFLQSDLADIKLESDYLDRALTRSVLVHIKEKQPAFDEIYRVLKQNGMYCAFEPIISQNTRYYELLNEEEITDYADFKKAEQEFMENPLDPLVNFTAETLDENLNNSGFSDVLINVIVTPSRYTPNNDTVKNWFINPPAPDQKTMKERYLDYFEEKKVDDFIAQVEQALVGKEIEINSKIALIQAVK